MMGSISPNLSRSEFLCRCGCGLSDPHPFLVVGLQHLVDLANDQSAQTVRVIITGPGRCPKHNAAVGGAPKSRHLPQPNGYYLAVDCHLTGGLSLRDQYRLAQQIPVFRNGGIGLYMDDGGPRMHLDVRGMVDPYRPGRWARLDGSFEEEEEVLLAADEYHRSQQGQGGEKT